MDAYLVWDPSSPSTPLTSFSAKTVEISSFVFSKMADCVPASPLQNFAKCPYHTYDICD